MGIMRRRVGLAVKRACAAGVAVCAFISPMAAGGALRDITEPASPPTEVSVGMYLSDVPGIDLRGGLFAFDAYLWLVWDPSKFQAIGEADPSSPLPRSPADTYELMGVHELDSTCASSRPGYAVFRIQGKVRQSFDLERFPLDEHVLTIRVQDSESEAHRVIFRPDDRGSVARGFDVHGWKPGQFSAIATSDVFETDFGDAELLTGSKAVYSCVEFQMPLLHDGWSYFFKLTAAMFIATLVALLAFLIRPINLDPRFGLPIGALFAAVASNWMVSEALPDRSGLTLADWLHILSYVAIFLTLLLSVRSLGLFEAGDEAGAKRFDRRCISVLAASYIVTSIALVVLYKA
jgi:hypothetical protein